MARIKPFKGIRPPKDLIEQVASRPYDVLNSEEAREEAKGNEKSLYHIIKPEIDFPVGTDEHDPAVYLKAAANFRMFQEKGWLVQDKEECYYVYAQTMNGKTQYGLVVGAYVPDYMNGVIKKHELTRRDKEEDRMKHVRVNNANIEPVFFAYPDNQTLTALIERKINKYISSFDGICKRLEKDKYMVVLRKKSMEMIEQDKFDLLEDVKTVNIGNEMAVTVSIGIGLDGLTYAQNYEFARNAIDLALGRGGDQAVVKTPKNIVYYGGKSQQVEKNTRVKAQALREIISGKENVLIMGHRIPDVDSFGAAVGIYRVASTLGRQTHIVLNEVSTSMKPMVDHFRHHQDYAEGQIVSNQQAMELAGSNTGDRGLSL